MLDAGIIEPVKESKWISPVVVQDKKTSGEVRICINLRKLNDACLNDLFLTPFTDEVLENFERKEMYTFSDVFFGYHKISIAKEDRERIPLQWGGDVSNLQQFPSDIRMHLCFFLESQLLLLKILYTNFLKSILMIR